MTGTTEIAPLFVYGTLRDQDVRAIVLGPFAAAVTSSKATLAGHAVMRTANEDYPQLAPDPEGVVDGQILNGLSDQAMERIMHFEGIGEYRLVDVEVITSDGQVPATALFASEGYDQTDGAWSFSGWSDDDRHVFLECTREYMDHFDALPEDGTDIWPGITHRARARVRAQQTPVAQEIRSGLTRDDVESLSLTRPYARYFGVEEHSVRIRKFNGTMSEPMLRATFVSGDAVTVLPWDPRTDQVLLIEQWRAGPWARGDRAPWMLEPIAGRIDSRESPEATARREAMEEAGQTLGRMEHVASYYTSPGTISELLISFVAEADLTDAGGVHGLASEQEDIRARVVPFEVALAAAERGEGGNAPLLLTLYWLLANKSRMLEQWQAPVS